MHTTAFASLFPPSVQLTKRGLTITEAATQEDQELVESLLLDTADVLPFAWGDYLNYLASTRGEEYAQAKALGRYAPGTSRTMQWVCRQVPVSRRRDSLSFKHHAEVAKLTPTEQELMLARAEEEEWSAKELRAEVRKMQQTIQDATEDKAIDARAAAGTRAWQEFSPWFQAQYPTMPTAQKMAWRDTVWGMVKMMAAESDTDEWAELEEARMVAHTKVPPPAA